MHGDAASIHLLGLLSNTLVLLYQLFSQRLEVCSKLPAFRLKHQQLIVELGVEGTSSDEEDPAKPGSYLIKRRKEFSHKVRDLKRYETTNTFVNRTLTSVPFLDRSTLYTSSTSKALGVGEVLYGCGNLLTYLPNDH